MASDFTLPGAIPARELSEPAITLSRAGTLAPPDAPTLAGPNWSTDGERFFLRIPRVASFLISGGSRIEMQLEPGVEEDDAVVFLLGSAFGVLLYQRRKIVLHASAVRVGDRAVLFCGKSGAGKSTLAAALTARGYDHVSDDVSCIDLDAAGHPIVVPDGRMHKLWLDSLTGLDLAARKNAAIRRKIEKYYVEPAQVADPAALPVAAIYALRELRPPLAAGIEKPGTLDAVQILRRCLYRGRLMAQMGLSGEFLVKTAAIQRQAGTYYLTRAFDLAALPEVIDGLETHWRALGIA